MFGQHTTVGRAVLELERTKGSGLGQNEERRRKLTWGEVKRLREQQRGGSNVNGIGEREELKWHTCPTDSETLTI